MNTVPLHLEKENLNGFIPNWRYVAMTVNNWHEVVLPCEGDAMVSGDLITVGSARGTGETTLTLTSRPGVIREDADRETTETVRV